MQLKSEISKQVTKAKTFRDTALQSAAQSRPEDWLGRIKVCFVVIEFNIQSLKRSNASEEIMKWAQEQLKVVKGYFNEVKEKE